MFQSSTPIEPPLPLNRCDQFPVSRAKFFSRLSKVLGPGFKNSDGLTPLRPAIPHGEEFLGALVNLEKGAEEIMWGAAKICGEALSKGHLPNS